MWGDVEVMWGDVEVMCGCGHDTMGYGISSRSCSKAEKPYRGRTSRKHVD